MTIKTTTSMELGDITTVEFECGTCHTKTVFPIDKFTHPIAFCNVCEPDRQLLIQGTEDYGDLVKLAQIIKRFAKLDPKRFVMRFEIKNVSASREGV